MIKNFQIGDVVYHADYGVGILVRCNCDEGTLVKFCKAHDDLHNGAGFGHKGGEDKHYWYTDQIVLLLRKIERGTS